MSEPESNPKSLKLKLSRSTQKAHPNTESSQENEPSPQPSSGTLKLRRSSTKTEPEAVDAIEPSEPQQPKASPAEPPLKEPQEVDSHPLDQPDPKPGDSLESSPPTRPESDQFAVEAEPAGESNSELASAKPNEPAPKKPSAASIKEEKGGGQNLLASILIILFLIGILAASAFGIWFVLMQPGSDQSDLAPQSQTQTEPTSPKQDAAPQPDQGPIARAKEVIASVPERNLESISGLDAFQKTEPPEEEAAPQRPKPATVDLAQLRKQQQESSGADIPDTTTISDSPTPGIRPIIRETRSTSKPAVPDQRVIQEVSAFISGVHIDGLRRGAKPKVMIGGISYMVGDVIDPSTGLRFDGMRDEKLAFVDKNGVVYLKSF